MTEEKNIPNYWQHRIKGGDYALPLATPLLFKHRILSIGWSHINNATFLENLKSISAWSKFEEQLFSVYKKRSTNRYSLWRYLHEMKAGDIVVVPAPGEFSIYRIVDDVIMTSEDLPREILVDWWDRPIKQKGGYLIDADGHQVDLGYFRKVEPIMEHISRDKCNMRLYNKMKAHQTNISLNGVEPLVQEIINKSNNH